MRYSARWSNGFWKTFDHKKFSDVALHHTKKEAEASASKMNNHK